MAALDLNLVRVFVAIYQTRSVTQAAQRLSLTQPTLSYSLARLREAYGDRLFLRGAGQLTPTTLADQLYEKFAGPLAVIEGTLQQRQHFDPLQSTRRFRLAMSDIGSLYFVPPLLRRFQESAPRVEIEIVPVSDTTEEELIVGKLDVAIGNLPALRGRTHDCPLFEEHYVCLMAKEYPARGKAMSLAEFAAGRHILVTSPFSGHHLVDEALEERGARRHVVARVPHFTVVPQLLARSELMVILPSRVAGFYVRQGGLKARDLPVQLPAFTVRVHWHAGKEGDPAHQWLVEELVQTLGKL